MLPESSTNKIKSIGFILSVVSGVCKCTFKGVKLLNDFERDISKEIFEEIVI